MHLVSTILAMDKFMNVEDDDKTDQAAVYK